jgi:hypothetical protein
MVVPVVGLIACVVGIGCGPIDGVTFATREATGTADRPTLTIIE